MLKGRITVEVGVWLMKLVFIDHLKGTEVLAKSILNNEGKILLKEGVTLRKELLTSLKNYGIFIIYVKDDNLEDISEDKHLSELKQVTLTNMPNIFSDLVNNNEAEAIKSLGIVNELLDYIVEKENVNTNLYEVKSYDDYTYIHCVDTSIMSSFLGLNLGIKGKELRELGMAAILHDIGKTKVPNNLINKKGPLTEEEFMVVKKHTIFGAEILKKSSLFSKEVIDSVCQHHERVDGKGYPYGLKDKEINYFAKIISICDVYTALSSNRSYRKRFNPNEAYEQILSGAYSSFDYSIVKVFRETFAIYPLGCCLKLSNDIEGYVVRQNKYYPDRPVIRVLYDHITRYPIVPFEIDLLKATNVTVNSIVL